LWWDGWRGAKIAGMRYIVGIDEVGRGPLAGPVTLCVISCEIKLYKKLKKDKRLPGVGLDSKKLSEKDREKYAKILKYIGVPYVVANVSNKNIDEKGISACINGAISKGIKKLELNSKQCEILLDGGLKAPREFKKQKTIIKGDEKEKIIAWASILAKVSRDALMIKLSKKYPKYGFAENKGYGTLKHRMAIKKHGLSSVHRKSFCGKFVRS
jgi:ribonuclease HII